MGVVAHTPVPSAVLKRVARAILISRIGEEGAARCEEGDSLAWKDAQKYARVAIEAYRTEAASMARDAA